MPPCLTLSIIMYVSRVKWSNPGKGVAPSPTPLGVVAIEKGANFYISNVYIYIYIYMCVCVCVCVYCPIHGLNSFVYPTTYLSNERTTYND